MSARNLLPTAAALAEQVAPAVPPTTREGLLARIILAYGRIRRFV